MARTAAPGTRERILDVAEALFYSEGVRAVGMSRIIGEAGCGKNLLYGHFPSKSDLVAAYLDRFRRRLSREQEQALREAGDDPAGKLVALVAQVAGWRGKPGFRGCPFRNLLTEFPDGDELPERMAREYLLETRDLVGRLAVATGAADPEALADRVWLSIDGLYGHLVTDRAATAAVELAREVIAAAR